MEGAELLRFPSPRPTRWRDTRFAWTVLREGRVDCAVANFGSENAVVLAAALAGTRVRVAWYHTLIEQIVRDRGGWGIGLAMQVARKKLFYSLATQVVGNSRRAADELRQFWQLPGRKIRYFWYSIPDPQADVGPPKRSGDMTCLCPGRLCASKGQDVLLRALPAVVREHPEVEVFFAGGGPERERLERLAEELGMNGRVRFLGAVERGRLLEMMGEAAVTVVPSREEAFGLVNIESMAMGTPVVASRVGGIAEIVRDGVDGMLFEPGNPEALAACLVRMLKDGRMREEMGRNARRRFLEEFESGRMAERQADWLEGLVREILTR